MVFVAQSTTSGLSASLITQLDPVNVVPLSVPTLLQPAKTAPVPKRGESRNAQYDMVSLTCSHALGSASA